MRTVLCKWQKRGQAFCLANSNPKNSKNASLGRVLPGGLPAARNRANGAARVPKDHERARGALPKGAQYVAGPQPQPRISAEEALSSHRTG